MGCGKSSVGRELSQLLCCPFMDLDQVIEEREGRSIPEIFASEGEEAFRAMELDALRNIVSGWERTTSPNLHHAEVNHQVIARCDATCQSADCERPSLVLALGGGAVMTAECAEIVHSDTISIYMKASVDTLMEHLSGQTDNRPLLDSSSLKERIETLMTQRSATYEKTAHIIIDTDGKSVEAVASEIISKLG